MIGLDTNILVRYFVKDDPGQTQRTAEFIYSLSPANPGWVGLAVILELIWAVTRIYKVKKERVIQILGTLLASKDIVVDQADTVRAALHLYRLGNTDFADCLIAASAKAAGCSRTVTFDRIAARDAGMELL
jgi:predicted nucleic-acid-binding protein